MANNSSKNKMASNKGPLLMKLIIVFIILLIPVIYLLLTSSDKSIVYKQADQPKQIETTDMKINNEPVEDDFELNVPTEKMGNLDNVDRAEIDSLFDNLQ